jgi:hypothetical protein
MFQTAPCFKQSGKTGKMQRVIADPHYGGLKGAASTGDTQTELRTSGKRRLSKKKRPKDIRAKQPLSPGRTFVVNTDCFQARSSFKESIQKGEEDPKSGQLTESSAKEANSDTDLKSGANGALVYEGGNMLTTCLKLEPIEAQKESLMLHSPASFT